MLRLLVLLTKLLKLEGGKKFLTAQKEFGMLLTQFLLEPTKYGFVFKTSMEQKEFTSCYVGLLSTIKSNWNQYYLQLEQYFVRLYLTNQIFSPVNLLERVLDGKPSKVPIHVYETLAKNDFFMSSVDKNHLLDIILSHLPTTRCDCERLSPDIIKDLHAYVGLIFSSSCEAVKQKTLTIIMSQEEKYIWFLENFSFSFYESILANIEELFTLCIKSSKGVHQMISLLVRLLVQKNNPPAVSLLLRLVMQHWGIIVGNIESRTDVLQAVHVIRTLSRLPSLKLNDCSKIVTWYCSVLKNKNVILKVKAKCLQVLGTIVQIKSQENLRDCLITFSSLDLPATSAEIPESSGEYQLYRILFQQLLKALEATRSPDVLYFILSLACREVNHICEEEIQASLSKLMSSSSTDQQLDLIDVPYQIFQDKSGIFTNEVRFAAITRFAAPLLQSSSVQSVRNFFTVHMEQLLFNVSLQITGNEDRKINKLTTKIGTLNLFSVLYYKLEPALVHAPGSMITSQAASLLKKHDLFPCKGDGKEMSGFLLKSLKEARKHNDFDCSDRLKDVYRQYHCARLNCCISIVSCTNSVEKVYNHFIFKEVKADGELIWSRIVDVQKTVKLELVLDKDFLKRKQRVMVKQSASNGFYNDSASQSHYLSDSSLSQDLSHYDYTASMSEGYDDSGSKEVKEETNVNDFIEIEEDDIGSNPCLVQLVALAEHMQANKIYTVPTDYGNAGLTLWMQSIHGTLTDPTVHRNIKLFLLKFIVDCSDIFMPFCVKFYQPILECMVDGTLSPDGSLNYMIHDLLIMMLHWSEETKTIPQKNLTTSQVLSLMIKNIYHEEKRVFKRNIEIVNLILQNWRASCSESVQFSLIEDLLDPQESEGTSLGALKILEILLKADFVDSSHLGNPKLLQNIAKLLKSSRKEVFEAAGSVIGLLLNSVKEMDADEKVKKTFFKSLNDLSSQNSGDSRVRFISVLHKISINFGDIMQDYASKFQYSLKTMSGEELSLSLQMLSHQAAQLVRNPDVLSTELNMIDLKYFLQRNDPFNQSFALQILKVCHLHLQDAAAKDYYDIVNVFINSKYSDHRKLAYQILQEACLNKDISQRNHCLEKILFGLDDSNDEIRKECFTFLNEKLFASQDSFEKMKHILEDMHFKDHELRLLSFLPTSILKLAECNPSFSQKIFSEPLDQCNFVEYNVDTTWRMQHAASLMPMYADTLSSQSQDSSQSQSGQLLRATLATLEFSQTQASAGSKTIPPSSLNSPVSQSQGYRTSIGSRQPYKVGNLLAGRRFTKEQQDVGYQKAIFSKLAARNKVRDRQLEEDKLKSSQKSVVLMRKYRKGDLPDIQISYSDLVAPILLLSQHSKDISKVLFHDILSSLFVSNNELMNDDAQKDFSNIINKIFQVTEVQSLDFILEILDLCLNFTFESSLDTKKISQVCQQRGLEQSGVLLLEKYLTEGNQNERSSKKMKRTKENTANVDLHIQLTDLYRSAGEHEQVKGVYMQNQSEMNVHEDTGAALNHEANGSWSGALKLYKKLLENEDIVENHLPQEVEIWQKGFYVSNEKLGKWEDLSNSISTTFHEINWNVNSHELAVKALLTGSMHVCLVNGSSEIYTFLNKANKDEDKKNFLSKNCPLEISVLFCLRDRYEEGMKVCQEGKDALRNSIFSGSSCFQNNGTAGLLHLQALHELYKYSTEQAVTTTASTNKQKLWLENIPPLDCDLNEWDTILSMRGLFVNKIVEGKSHNYDISALKKLVSSGYAELASSSIEQKNASFAQRCLMKMKKFGGNDHSIQMKRSSLISKVLLMNTKIRTDLSPVDHFCSVFKSSCKEQVSLSKKDLAIYVRDVNECLYNIANSNSKVTPSVLKIQMKNETETEQFKTKFGSMQDDNQSLTNYLLDQLLENYSTVLKEEKAFEKESNFLFEGSSFAHDLWQKENEIKYGELSVLLHMKALEGGSITAREMIPRVINVIITEPKVGQTFMEACKSVPSWMFLHWGNQLISVLHNEAISKYFVPLTARLVEDYPNALAYPVKSAGDNMDLTDSTLNVFLKLVAKLQFSTVHEKLIKELQLLVVPSVAFHDLFGLCTNHKKQSPKTLKLKAEAECQEFKKKYLSHPVGPAFKMFAKEFGSKIDGMISSFNMANLKPLKDAVDAKYSKFSLSRVKDYSPFIAEFLSSNFTDLIEIPGQYKGFERPDPERHVTLSSFDPSINIFKSIRKPFELRMLGSDGRKYRFILKAGEDLRQDQRIESLFEICNVCISHDVSCKNKSMKIRTYGVIPLTQTYGLIEFVPNTRTLKDFMSFDPKANPDMLKARHSYMNGIAKLSGDMTFRKVGGPKQEDILKNYQNAVNSTETKYLKNAMMMISSSPQGFFYLRKNFISSYAVVCIMQWILGK